MSIDITSTDSDLLAPAAFLAKLLEKGWSVVMDVVEGEAAHILVVVVRWRASSVRL